MCCDIITQVIKGMMYRIGRSGINGGIGTYNPQVLIGIQTGIQDLKLKGWAVNNLIGLKPGCGFGVNGYLKGKLTCTIKL